MFDIWHSEKHLSPFCDPFCYLLTNNQESVSFNLFLFFSKNFRKKWNTVRSKWTEWNMLYWFTYGFAAFVAIFHFLASVIQILYFTLKRLKRPRFALEILNFPRVHIFFGQNCCTAHNLDPNTNSYINLASTRIQTSIKHQLIEHNWIQTQIDSNINSIHEIRQTLLQRIIHKFLSTNPLDLKYIVDSML